MKYEVYVRTIVAGPGFGPYMTTGEMGSRNAKPYVVEEAIATRLLGREVENVDPNDFAKRYPESALFGIPILVDDNTDRMNSGSPKSLQEQMRIQQGQIEQLQLMLRKRSNVDGSNIDHSILPQQDVPPKHTPTIGELEAQKEAEKKLAPKYNNPSLPQPVVPVKPEGKKP